MNGVPPKPEIGREVATTGDGMDITRGYVGPLLVPYDSILRQRGQGDLLIYEQVSSDPQVKTVFGQRTSAVVQREWKVDPGGDKRIDKQAAAFVSEMLHRVGWDRVTEKMLYSVFYGYAVAELIYGRDGARVTLDAIKVRNRRRFRFDPDGGLRLLTLHDMSKGLPCKAPYFWHIATGADHDDEPYGLGLAHWLYWPVLFKRNGLKFWLIFLDKFGMPTGVGKYDPNTATPEDRARLLAAVRAIQTDSGVTIPQDMAIELMEAARSGTADYKVLHDTMDATIAKVVLGQTASTEGTPGRLGNDDLQGDVRQDIIKADSDLVCESFNLGPARWLTYLNFPGAAPPRVYREIAEPEDLTARAQRDKIITDIGFKPSLAYIQETYGGEWEDKAPAAPAEDKGHDGDDKADDSDAAFAEGQDGDGTAPERLADRLTDDLAPATDAWIDAIRDLVNRAERLEDIRAGLDALLPGMETGQYAEAMAQALAAAALLGRADIMDEAVGVS